MADGSRPHTRGPTVPSPRLRPPRPLSSFVGRDDEIGAVVARLRRHRLVTLTGPGGCGKTRLALAVASSSGRDTVWFDLLAVPAGGEVGPALAAAFGIERAATPQLVDAVAATVADDEVLLLADNAEHVLDAVAAAVRALLERCPRLAVLATSREPLGVSGEVVRVVPPLALPPADVTPEALPQFPAVRCFLERADAASGGITGAAGLSLERATAVARLCRRLDGLPLALELAAARTTALSVEQIDRRLDDAMRLLTTGPRDEAAHHRTLRATLDWSHRLLPGAQQRLLRRLSVFAGTFTLDAAEQVCSDAELPDNDVLDQLSGLVARSMLDVVADSTDGRRFRLLETVRQYARENLNRSGEADRTAARHAAHYLRLTRAVDARLRRGGGDQQALLTGLEADHENLRAALAWASSVPGRSRLLVELATAAWWFWWKQGDFPEGTAWLRRAGSALDGTRPPVDGRLRAEVQHGLGWLVRHQGGLDEARERLTSARAGYAELGDTAAEAVVLHRLAAVEIDAGDTDAAARLLAASLARAREAGDGWAQAAATYWEGVRRRLAGQPAADLLREAADLFAGCGDRWAVGRAHGMLASALVDNGSLVAAEAALLEARAGGEATGDRWGLALWWLCEAELHLARDDAAAAARAAAGGLAGFTALGDRRRIGEVVAVSARIAEAAGDGAAAARVRAGGPATAGQVIAALAGRAGTRRRPAGLTEREVEVLRLAAEGLSDDAIAERLVLSRRTVGGHLGAAYRKLAVRSRTAAVRQAALLGLLPDPGIGTGTSAHPGRPPSP